MSAAPTPAATKPGHGIIPALVTPLGADGTVSEAALRQLVRHVLDGGVHGVFPMGGSGEYYAFTAEEKRRTLEVTIDEVRGRVPVYFGAGGNTTRECIALARMAERVGADVLSIITPTFIGPSQEELYLHYAAIAEQTALPIILYNNLPKTGCTIAPNTVKRLAEIANVVGIKDSSGDFSLTEEYARNAVGRDFALVIGRDSFIYSGLCIGAVGAISSHANLAPRLCTELYDRFRSGDHAAALACQRKVTELREIMRLGTFPAALKVGLTLLGIDAGACIAPVLPLCEGDWAQVRQVMLRVGLIPSAAGAERAAS